MGTAKNIRVIFHEPVYFPEAPTRICLARDAIVCAAFRSRKRRSVLQNQYNRYNDTKFSSAIIVIAKCFIRDLLIRRMRITKLNEKDISRTLPSSSIRRKRD